MFSWDWKLYINEWSNPNLIGRIMAVDLGDKRIGIALSDPTQTLASPLMILNHVSRKIDAEKIVEIAERNQVVKIILGHNLDADNRASIQGIKASRLADFINNITDIDIQLWDESGSTQRVNRVNIEMNVPKKKRKKQRDDLAAMMILQDYLDAHLD